MIGICFNFLIPTNNALSIRFFVCDNYKLKSWKIGLKFGLYY